MTSINETNVNETTPLRQNNINNNIDDFSVNINNTQQSSASGQSGDSGVASIERITSENMDDMKKILLKIGLDFLILLCGKWNFCLFYFNFT